MLDEIPARVRTGGFVVSIFNLGFSFYHALYSSIEWLKRLLVIIDLVKKSRSRNPIHGFIHAMKNFYRMVIVDIFIEKPSKEIVILLTFKYSDLKLLCVFNFC